ncbi:hypothetical protein M413DRAFT_27027 [Hebeloma cylindrosporum]|uniref:Uncharacterized protein n=1 Tax=Hebeloma cylindrosporum TaxID=76867 RepID=A0A0C2YMK3_HEBCY|nr:hypothetical protein M413DRAFT_27027 [Hebeloma cylindrosporum h7]
MPQCFCVSSGCSAAGSTDPISKALLGKKVDIRTFKAHANADRLAALRAAEQNTEATVDGQMEEITAFLAASVLADEVSGPSQNPGSSLWSRLNNPEEYPPQLPTRHPASFIPICTLEALLYTLPLVKLGRGAHARLKFWHVWPISR